MQAEPRKNGNGSTVPMAPSAPRAPVDLSPNALMKPATGPAQIRSLFESPEIQKRIAGVIPKHLTPERMAKVAISCITKTPALLQCSQLSLLQGIIHLSELGLEPSSALGLAYLVPFKGSCTPIIGWRGYIELARRSGMVADVRARVVYTKDRVEYWTGIDEHFRVYPHEDADDAGPIRSVFCVAEFTPEWGGGHHMERMSIAQVMRVRDASPNGRSDFSPWATHFEQMALKTVIRRAAKYWPQSPELRRAQEVDGDTVDGEVVSRSTVASFQGPAAAFELPAPEQAQIPAHSAITGEVLEDAEAGEGAAAPVAAQPAAAATDGLMDPDTYAEEVERQMRAATTIRELADAGKKVRGLPADVETRLTAVFTELNASLRAKAKGDK